MDFIEYAMPLMAVISISVILGYAAVNRIEKFLEDK
jgi:hypothetical protein